MRVLQGAPADHLLLPRQEALLQAGLREVSGPLPPVSPRRSTPAARQAPAPCRKRGGLSIPLQLPASPAPCVPTLRSSVVSCASPPQLRCTPVLPFLEVFCCVWFVPWEFRSLLSGALVTPGPWRDGTKRFPVSSGIIFLLSVCRRNVISSLIWSWTGQFS